MGALTPWALLRLLPLTEVAASAAGSLSRETRGQAHATADLPGMVAHSSPDWLAAATARLRKAALGATPAPPAAPEPSVAAGELAPPQGGPGVTSHGSDEAPEQPEEAPQPEAGAKPEREPAAETVRYQDTPDIGIEQMWKPEHRGRWAP